MSVEYSCQGLRSLSIVFLGYLRSSSPPPQLDCSKEHREQVKKDNPEITFGGVGKKLGEMWRALSDKEKEEYKQK